MPFEKGHDKIAGSGRPKGSPNKVTAVLKEAILRAFENVGGVEYLTEVAQKDPKTFCALLAKVLPSEVNAKLDTTGPVQILVVSGIEAAPPGLKAGVEVKEIPDATEARH